jgi:hypothetical protein
VQVLASRVERLEAQEFDPSMGTRRITKSSDNRSVDHILVFSRRSIGNKKYNIVGREGTISTDGSFEKASLEWCRGNSKKWENPVREKHYSLFC